MTSRLSRTASSQSEGERGAVAVFAVFIVLAGFLACGVLIDYGDALSAKVATYDTAQQAARAGAEHLDLAALRATGRIRLDPVAARTAATAFLTAAGVQGSVIATTTRVQVTASSTHTTALLAAVGLKRLRVTATADAQPAATS